MHTKRSESQRFQEQYAQFSDLSEFFLHEVKPNTIILFGSVARKEDSEFSDIDLLLVTDFPHPRKGELNNQDIYSMIPKSLLPKNRKLNLAIYSKNNFEDIYRQGSLFMAHIIKEGVVLYDDGFYNQLTKRKFTLSKQNIKQSLAILRQRLSVANDLEKFNNFFITCLAEFYAISKDMAFIAIALQGKTLFDKEKAFAKFAETYPTYRHEIQRLHALRPFFLRNIRGIEASMPFEPIDCRDVVELRENIEELLCEVAVNAN